MSETHTEIDIDCPVERVREILTDFPAYRSWNPFIRAVLVNGELKPDAELQVTLKFPDMKDQMMKPKLLVVDKGKELRWIGTVPFGFFTGEHRWVIKENEDGKSCKVVHAEVFGGWGRSIILWYLGDRVEESFKNMNVAMKKRCEER